LSKIHNSSQHSYTGYLYTISKNDVISSVRKHYCALRLGLEFRLELRLRKYVFGQTCFRASVVESAYCGVINKKTASGGQYYKTTCRRTWNFYF